MGIIDDYFDGYYSEEMIESQVMVPILLLPKISCFLYVCFLLQQDILKKYKYWWVLDGLVLCLQVDQLVFEELVRERFPKLGLFLNLYI